MRPASARRTRSPAAGPSAAPVQAHRGTNGPLPPTSSVQSARRRSSRLALVHAPPRAGQYHHHSAAAEGPELNPVENVWQFMRDNWLSNRIFKSYDDPVDHCCAAWNKLVDQPWRIMAIGLRQWAHGF